MRRITWVVAVGAALAVLAGPAVYGQEAGTSPAAKPANSQQEKMKTCNADAKTKGLSGADRKSFMKTCLSDQPAAPAKTNSQQEKMKSCSKEASGKGLKGSGSEASK